jgi:DNA repair protein RAD5
MNEQAVTGCWHSACKQCLINYVEHERERGVSPKCFNCREPINIKDIFQVIRHDDLGEKSPRISLRRTNCDASAKISGLLRHLKQVRREHRNMKTVVFSQFTSFLDLIEPALTRDDIPFLRFDGTMAQKARAAVLDEFTASARGVVLLLSLRAGGVGLNLTAAKRVYMMDPWWSFAVEAQAIDRVHRMGQDGDVVVTRFIVAGSIEEKMLRIQQRKKFL